MIDDLWLNLPVQDLQKSIAFFTRLGFTPHPGPGNTAHSASFAVGSKKIILMLFAADMFKGFTMHPLADTSKGTEVLFSIGVDSRAKVDELTKLAREAGGTVFAEPKLVNGFMYGCGIADLDGHRWNALFMDMAALPK